MVGHIPHHECANVHDAQQVLRSVFDVGNYDGGNDGPDSRADHARLCPSVVIICARHPSQLHEALLEGVLLGALLIGYGSARTLVEFFRQPDAQFISPDNPIGHALQFGNWGMTMGQALSLPMALAGLGLSWWSLRKGRFN